MTTSERDKVKAAEIERVDKNTLVSVPPMSLACFSEEHRQCRNPTKCQCSCHPPVCTQAQMDAALTSARAETWEKAIEAVKGLLPELEAECEAEKPMAFIGGSYEMGQTKDIIELLEDLATTPAREAAKDGKFK